MATSVEGFVQQLAVAYVTHGYWFYVTGEIPEGKDPSAVDRKLIARYGIAISKWARVRRKRQGLANMQYLRHDRLFVLLATKGRHAFFEQERPAIRDIRRVPIKFAGYSISCRRGRDGRWHASVRICAEGYMTIKATLETWACFWPAERIVRVINSSSYVPYAPVRRQLLNLFRLVNRLRMSAGQARLPARSICLQRHVESCFIERE